MINYTVPSMNYPGIDIVILTNYRVTGIVIMLDVMFG